MMITTTTTIAIAITMSVALKLGTNERQQKQESSRSLMAVEFSVGLRLVRVSFVSNGQIGSQL